MNLFKNKNRAFVSICITFFTTFNFIHAMENYCLNIGDGICIGNNDNVHFSFDGDYIGNTFKVYSAQNGNMIHFYVHDNEPFFILNGHAYPPSLQGIFHLVGQDLYSSLSCKLVQPLEKHVEAWKPQS